MSKRSISGESSSTAHKRQALAPQDEDPLPSTSASLAQQASSSSIPKTPLDLMSDLVLPFVADRATWNSICSTNNELRRAGKKMTPPWPSKSFNLGHLVRHVAFSPSGLQLGFACNASFTFGIDGARKPSSRVALVQHVAWNSARWMGSIWRQEAKMDRFESGAENHGTPLPLQTLTGKDPHGHQNMPAQFLEAAAFTLLRCSFRGRTPISWHQEDCMARSRCGM
jgi:hypothetical protein